VKPKESSVYLLHANVSAKAALVPKETKVPSETPSPTKSARTNLVIINKTLAPKSQLVNSDKQQAI
jgi:hypothetical protein